MADSFNMLQEQVRDAAFSLDEARENMRVARAELLARHVQIVPRPISRAPLRCWRVACCRPLPIHLR